MSAQTASLLIAGGFVLSALLMLWDTYQMHKAVKRILTPPAQRADIYTRTDGPFPREHCERIARNLKASGVYSEVRVIPAGRDGLTPFFHVQTLRK